MNLLGFRLVAIRQYSECHAANLRVLVEIYLDVSTAIVRAYVQRKGAAAEPDQGRKVCAWG